MIRIVREVMLPLRLGASDARPRGGTDRAQIRGRSNLAEDASNNWIIGTIGGITVDAQDHIWGSTSVQAPLDAREKRASTAPNVKCCVPAPR